MSHSTPTTGSLDDHSPIRMAAAFMSELVSLSNPEALGERLTQQVRELTGAQTILLLQHRSELEECHVLNACPPQRTPLFNESELHDFCSAYSPEECSGITCELDPDHPLFAPLTDQEIQSFLQIPLNAAGKMVGAIILLNLPEPDRMEDVRNLFEILSPFLGISLKNALDQEYSKQQTTSLEDQVRERTRELEQARRAALNIMEDVIESKERLELTQFAVDHLGDASFRIKKDGSIVAVNQAACQSLGYTEEELLELQVSDVSPEFPNECWGDHWKELAENKHLRFETLHRRKNGETFPVEVLASYVCFGQQEYNFAFAHDITNRKANADKILRNSKNLQVAIDTLRHDASSTAEFLDYALEKALHLTESKIGYIFLYDDELEEFMLYSYSKDVMSECDVARPISCYELSETGIWGEAVRQQKPFFLNDFQAHHPLKKGVPTGHVQLTNFLTVPVFSQNKIVAVVGLANKSSDYDDGNILDLQLLMDTVWKSLENMKATDALKASEAEFRSTMNDLLVGVIVHAADTSILMCNPQASHLLGLSHEQLLSKTAADPIWRFVNEHRAILATEEYPVNRVISTGKPLVDQILGIRRPECDEITWVTVSATPTFTSENKLDRVIVNFLDITERKRLEEALETRVLALTRPLEDHVEISFDELFNLEEIQRIQKEFAQAAGVASIITLPDGTPLTEPSNFTDLCMNIIRKTEKGCANCFKSDAALGQHHSGGPIVQHCLSGGLWDAGARIEIGGRHIANWLIGQVRDEAQTDEQMRAYAQEIGADEKAFMDAFHNIPVMSREHFEEIAQSLYTLSSQLSTSAYQNIQQARFISDQKKTEAALRKSEEHLRIVTDNLPILISQIDTDLKYTFANQYYYDVGEVQDSIIGKDVVDIIGKETFNRALPHMQKVLAGEVVSFENKHLTTKNNREIILETHYIPHLMKGQVDSFFVLGVDITERKASEAELRRLSTAIEQSPETIVITDPDGVIQYTNPAFEVVTGYRVDEAIGQKPSILSSGEHSTEFYAEIWETIASGGIWEGRIVNKRKDGSLYTEEATLSPVKDAEGRIINYVAVKRDISDELIREEEFRQAQKMDAIGQLASGVAHDFNNILQGIQGFSELLQMKLAKDSMEYRNAAEIQKAAKRAAALTQQLLTFSRKHPSLPEEIDLNHVVHDAEALMNILLGETFDFVLELDESLLSVLADPGQLSQIIMNLAVNARDAMPGGGRLTLSTRAEIFSQKEVIGIPHARPGAFACLSVTDTGCGISAEIMDRIFDPFFTTKAVGSGTGLGLSVIFGIVQQAEGWINVYSEKDLGTTFTVYLPLVSSSEHVDDNRLPATKRPANSRILLIEDDPDVTSMVITVLSEAGYNILASTNAEDGLKLFEKERGRFDLLMSDMMLPGMDGCQLADAIRTINPTLPVMLFSGYTDHKTRWKHLAQTEYHFENKPFTTDRLVASVKRVLNN